MRATRRGFLLGLGVLIAAPAVVKVSSIMPVRVPFDQRWSWAVYGAEGAREVSSVPLRIGGLNNDIPAFPWPPEFTRLDRGEALSGVELQRYEALDLPRVELLRIGDRVVDKRITGGRVAEILTERDIKTDGEYAAAPWAIPIVQLPRAGLPPLVTRAEVEARHQRSTRARRQAADVLARHAQWVGR